MIERTDPVTVVPGVSARAATVLRDAFGILTVRDLLEHYPRTYRDIGERVNLAEATPGEQITVVGEIQAWTVQRPQSRSRGKRMVIAKATLRDQDGAVVSVPFFNQEWRVRSNPEGSRVAVSGQLERFRNDWQLKNAKLVAQGKDLGSDLGSDEDLGEHERVQPVYPATEAIPSPRIAGMVTAALEQLGPLPEYLPEALRERHGLWNFDQALRTIHHPADPKLARPARDRLVYDELLCLQVGLQRRRYRLESQSIGLDQAPVPGGLAERFLAALPFTPTHAQDRAFAEIGKDLARPKPMHRLLQGDVGAGKTLVAAWAMLTALDHGRQAFLMAPTEVLAEQHLRTLTSLLAPLGVNVLNGPRLELLTGATPAKKLRGLLAEVASGDVQLLVGTHALLEDRVQPVDLGVVIVDEQHRFGVEHRTRLRDKRGDDRSPDVLVMTATPIPRSLALTLYGDLDVTVLDELPPGRQPIHTEVIDADSPRRAKLYDFIRERVAAGERAYVVCPLVEDSDALRVVTEESERSIASAQTMFQRLSTEVFADLSVGLVHGRLSASQRDTTMEAFRRGDVQILVATTVIEVGVDVPQATVMVIEDADRFGLSQLHQLRGRVGRGSGRSYCVLFSARVEDNVRLEALASTSDGFQLAETDLELRGEGSLFDTRQSGLPDLKLATLIRDFAWVMRARDDARELVEADPQLQAHPELLAEVRHRYGDERLAALETG